MYNKIIVFKSLKLKIFLSQNKKKIKANGKVTKENKLL